LQVPKRIDTPELLDDENAPPADVDRSLRDLRRFNRYAGGRGVYRRLLRKMAPDRGQRLTIIDIATGTADLLESLPDQFFRIGVDFKIEHLLYKREGSPVHRVVGNALRLPFRSASADIVTSSHFLHHLSPEGNAEMLHEALRVARRGAIVNDTLRHYVPLIFVRLLALLRLVGRITRNDAPASILRGYTIEEARLIAGKVNASRFDVVSAWPFRFGILLWR
jgi:ubiquinone/menaquinone biosynthesis C-methylase UbiE